MRLLRSVSSTRSRFSSHSPSAMFACRYSVNVLDRIRSLFHVTDRGTPCVSSRRAESPRWFQQPGSRGDPDPEVFPLRANRNRMGNGLVLCSACAAGDIGYLRDVPRLTGEIARLFSRASRANGTRPPARVSDLSSGLTRVAYVLSLRPCRRKNPGLRQCMDEGDGDHQCGPDPGRYRALTARSFAAGA